MIYNSAYISSTLPRTALPTGSGRPPARRLRGAVINYTYDMICYAVLRYAIIYYTILQYTMLYYTILYYTTLY